MIISYKNLSLPIVLVSTLLTSGLQAMLTPKTAVPVEAATEETEVMWHDFENAQTQVEQKTQVDLKTAQQVDWSKIKADAIKIVNFDTGVQFYDSQNLIALSRVNSPHNVLELYDLTADKRYSFQNRYESWILPWYKKLSDGTLVVCLYYGRVALWRPGNEPLYLERCHDSTVDQVIELDDQRIAVTARKKHSTYTTLIINVYDLRTRKCITTLLDNRPAYLPVVKVNANSLAYAVYSKSDGSSIEQNIHIADLSKGKCENMLDENGCYIGSFVALNDNTVASCGRDKIIKIWDRATLGLKQAIRNPHLDEHTQLCRLNDDTLLSYSKKSPLTEYDIKHDTRRVVFGCGDTGMVIRLDDKTIANHHNGMLTIHDIKTDKCLVELKTGIDKYSLRSMLFDGTAIIIENVYGHATMFIVDLKYPEKSLDMLSLLAPDIRQAWQNRQAKLLIEHMHREAGKGTSAALRNIIFDYARE